jgi:hypothetical protein
MASGERARPAWCLCSECHLASRLLSLAWPQLCAAGPQGGGCTRARWAAAPAGRGRGRGRSPRDGAVHLPVVGVEHRAAVAPALLPVGGAGAEAGARRTSRLGRHAAARSRSNVAQRPAAVGAPARSDAACDGEGPVECASPVNIALDEALDIEHPHGAQCAGPGRAHHTSARPRRERRRSRAPEGECAASHAIDELRCVPAPSATPPREPWVGFQACSRSWQLKYSIENGNARVICILSDTIVAIGAVQDRPPIPPAAAACCRAAPWSAEAACPWPREGCGGRV